jgi:molybdopterin converting factor small subunit
VITVVFIIPGGLREFAAGRGEVTVSGRVATVSEALALLWAECPGARDRVLTERGEVRPHVNLFLDGENIRYTGGLRALVRDGSEVVILPAVSGGGWRRPPPLPGRPASSKLSPRILVFQPHGGPAGT